MSQWTLKEKSNGELIVTIEGDEWKNAVNKAFKKLADKVEIKGFRKGSAPKAIVEKRISVAERQYQAIDDNANAWLIAALDEQKLEPITRPSLDVKSMDDEKVELSFTFTVMPEVNLGTYTGFAYDLGDTTVTEDELNAELDRMRGTYADMEVKETEAENGDTVNIDYEGFKDGVAFDGGKAEGHDLVLGSNSFIPGFEEQLVGVKAGEEKELNLTFPEDYHAEDLKGAAVVFKVKVNEVKHKVLPELTDEFAKDVNAPGVETVEDLKKTVTTRLEETKKSNAESTADNALIDQLLAVTEVEIPEVLIDEEVNGTINQQAQQIAQYGIQFEQYLGMMGKTLDQLREEVRPDAEKNVKTRLALGKVAQLENLDPSDEDVEAEYGKIAAMYNLDVERVKSVLNAATVKEDLMTQLAFDFVKKNVKA